MNREDDRRDAARTDKNAEEQGRDRHVRERVHTAVTSMSRGSSREESSGSGIDRKMDRIASEQAIHTRDGNDGEIVRGTLERHRQEMRLASIAGAIANRQKATKQLGSAKTPGFQNRVKKLERATAEDPTGAGRSARTRRATRIDPDRNETSKVRTAANRGDRVRVAPRAQRGGPYATPPQKTHNFYTRPEGPIQLRPPDPSRIRIGGTVGAAAPERKGDLFTISERNRILGREQPAQTRANSPAR